MRLFAALAIVFVALLIATVRQATSTRGRSATSSSAAALPTTPEVEDDAPPPPRTPRLSHVAPASGDEGARGGIAHLHGRVLPAPGSEDTLGNRPHVIADDGVRSFTVRTTEDGKFSLHLPPGRYELIASWSEWSGSVSGVVAHAGTDRAIDIQLERGATISGTLRGGLAGDTNVTTWLAGRSTTIGDSDVSDRGFEITGLVRGHRYDIRISRAGARTAHLHDVIAPAGPLDIELLPLPVLRGAVGFPRGGHCPINTVTVMLSEDSDEDERVGPDCRFALTLPMEEVSVVTATVVATGSGWHVEQTFTVPARGDPDFVCLNPPCRANPLDGAARMLVTMEGHDNHFAMVHATTEDGPRSEVSCTSGTCVLEPLAPNRTYQVTASAEGCQEDVRDVAVTSGDNNVRFTCRRQRKIQGLLRAAGAPPPVEVRCTGGTKNVRLSRLFAITCAADDTALQYRVLPDGAWQSAAIPAAEDPPLVEIAL